MYDAFTLLAYNESFVYITSIGVKIAVSQINCYNEQLEGKLWGFRYISPQATYQSASWNHYMNVNWNDI